MNRKQSQRWTLSLCAAIMSGCATPPPHVETTPPSEALQAPADQALAVAAHAIGVQIYACRASDGDPAVFAWQLKAPEAELRYAAGKELGKHYAGPTWEANDGSKVVGKVVARDDSPQGKSIPWLLLRATQTSGNGVFAHVESIQRLHTAGGLAPTTGCTAAYAGTEVRVTYSADYYFYTARH